jgi:hypothetical protein
MSSGTSISEWITRVQGRTTITPPFVSWNWAVIGIAVLTCGVSV